MYEIVRAASSIVALNDPVAAVEMSGILLVADELVGLQVLLPALGDGERRDEQHAAEHEEAEHDTAPAHTTPPFIVDARQYGRRGGSV